MFFIFIEPLVTIVYELQVVCPLDKFREIKDVAVGQVCPNANKALVQVGKFPDDIETDNDRVGRKTRFDRLYVIHWVHSDISLNRASRLRMLSAICASDAHSIDSALSSVCPAW